MPSILRRLYARCADHPDRRLYAFLDIDGRVTAAYTFAQFEQRTAAIAAHIYAKAPLATGARVLLAYPPGLEMVCALFACVRLGLIPVPVYPPSSHGFAAALAKMSFIAQDCGAEAVLTDRALYWSMKLNRVRQQLQAFDFKRSALSALRWIITDNSARSARRSFPERHSDVLFLQYTSGSTNDPKGVMVTHDNVLDNCDSVVDHLPIGVSWLPQYHDMGLLGYYIYFALKGGTTYGFSPIDFIRRPALWLEAISTHRGTATSAPNFAFEYCLRPGKVPEALRARLDLSSVRFMMCAAEPVRDHVMRAFVQAFEPRGLNPEALFAAYGLAENTLAVTNYGRRALHVDRAGLERDEAAEATPDQPSAAIHSCGRPLGETRVAIVREGRRLDDRRVGEVWVSGPSRCAGYWGRPALSEAVFEARVAGDARPWLRTGDLGFMQGGELFICGRLKDLIIVRGQNYYPQDIEALVEADPRVREGCVAAFAVDREGREQVVVVAELRAAEHPADAAALNAALRQRLGLVADVFVFIPARTIAKTSSGKIARHRVARQWRDGALNVLFEVDAQQQPSAGSDVARAAGAFDLLEGRYGLDRADTRALGAQGLDSLQIAELGHDLGGWLEAAGHDALTDLVDLRLLQQIAVAELAALCDQLEAARPEARLAFRRAFARLMDEHRAGEQARMQADARIMATPRHRRVTPTGRDILLTGGTGFLGPFLLRSLLLQQGADIYVLLRAEDEAAGRARIREGFAQLGPLAPEGSAARVHPICGDLSRANLGLSTETWDRLLDRIGRVYHNGALVNYLFDYDTMRDANVGGTREVVRFALEAGASLDHISTTFVFGWSAKDVLREADTNHELDLLDFGYSQTKWASEQIVKAAMTEGLPGRVYRPALITPTVDGHGYSVDIAIRLLAFMLKHGLGTTAHNQVSFVPVDIVADNIVAISLLEDTLGATYHITRDAYARLSDITALMGQMTGTAFRHVPLDVFVPAVIERCGKDDLLFPLLNFFVRSIDRITAMEFKRYDNGLYRAARDRSPNGRADPPLPEVVAGIVRFMRSHGIVEGLADAMGQPSSDVRRDAMSDAMGGAIDDAIEGRGAR